MYKVATVYKICNTVNDKVYIGATHYDLERRLSEHKREANKNHRRNRCLYQAMNQYGTDQFYIEPIEECPNDDTLYEREQYWVGFYDSYRNGYNGTLGGVGKAYVDCDSVIKTYSVLRRVNKTAEELGVDCQTVRKILREHEIHIETPKEIMTEERGIRVDMFDFEGKYIQTFSSSHEAARFVTQGTEQKSIAGVAGHIMDVCRGIRNTAYGYVWRTSKENTPV